MNKFIGNVIVGGVVVSGVVLFFAALLSIAAGVTLLEAWVADFVYSTIFETPTSNAPQITYWVWVGIVFLFNAVFGGRSATAVATATVKSRRRA